MHASAQRLASGSTRALGQMWRLMSAFFDRGLPEQLAAKAAAFGQCAQTSDFRAGVDAFFAKQAAQFRGY